ncbi:MAG: histidinol dehydrogenase [Thermodesulfobacteriota bacterium]
MIRILRFGEKRFDQYLMDLEGRIDEEAGRIEKEVLLIIEDVRRRGDNALLFYTQKFDNIRLSSSEMLIKEEEVRKAYQKVSPSFLKTLKKVCSRIRRFHQLTKRIIHTKWEEKGIRIEQRIKPLNRVGIYIPGGKASYPSTVLMATIPARVAGVKEIYLTTPPQPGGISPAILVAAHMAGAHRVYQVGGAQAIAALAYGTETIPRVDKIVGPGNRYVAVAKRLVYGKVDIDMFAGPSEIVIISDEETPPSFVASDMISQAEHDERAITILITPSENLAYKVKEEIERQLQSLNRNRIARISLAQRGAILIVRDLKHAIALANRIAPEHLELCLKSPYSLKKEVKNAGAVFLGLYSPEAIGDYMAGPNHILPTSGTARFSSALGVEDFYKKVHFIQFSKERLFQFEKDVENLTQWEKLEGHYKAIRIRREKVGS